MGILKYDLCDEMIRITERGDDMTEQLPDTSQPAPQYPPRQDVPPGQAYGPPPQHAKPPRSKLPLIVGIVAVIVVVVILILAFVILSKPVVEVKLDIQPSTADVGETVQFNLFVTNNGGETITVTSINVQEDNKERNKHFTSTIDEGTTGWKTATVPAGQTVLVYENTFVAAVDQIGTWTWEMTVHTSVGNFDGSTTFIVNP
jgi:hypothetical protein